MNESVSGMSQPTTEFGMSTMELRRNVRWREFSLVLAFACFLVDVLVSSVVSHKIYILSVVLLALVPCLF
jgi:hypothetical protein